MSQGRDKGCDFQDGTYELVKYLIRKYTKEKYYSREELQAMDDSENLYKSCQSGDVSSLSELLNSGLDVNFVFTDNKDAQVHGSTLLHVAVSHRQLHLASFLVSRNCDVNKAVQCVGFEGNRTKVKVNRSRNRLQWTCLFRALCMKDTAAIRLLVEGGADVNLYDRSLCSALWHAVDTNDEEIARIILRVPACDVNLQDTFKMSPLHVAATHSNCTVIKELIRRDAHVDIMQLQGATPLYLSCAYGDYRPVKIFLQHGANPNHLDTDGYTPLFAALDKGRNPDVIYSLINAGSSVSSKRILYSFNHLRILNENEKLREFVHEQLDSAQSLKILSALKIKELLRKRLDGLSIYKELGKIPLPRVMINYLQLKHL